MSKAIELAEDYLPPDLSDMTIPELCQLMLSCGLSPDKSDQEFAKACSKEIAKRKPQKVKHD